jgi:hypothetical protein
MTALLITICLFFGFTGKDVQVLGPAASRVEARFRLEDSTRTGMETLRRLYVSVRLADRKNGALVRILAGGKPALKPRLHSGGGSDWFLLDSASPSLEIGPWTQNLKGAEESELTLFVDTRVPDLLIPPGFILPMPGMELIFERKEGDAIVQAAGDFIWGKGSEKPITLVARRIEFALEGAIQTGDREQSLCYGLLLSFFLASEQALETLGRDEAFARIERFFSMILLKGEANPELLFHLISWMASRRDLEVAYSCLARQEMKGLHRDALHFALGRLSEELGEVKRAEGLYAIVPGSSPFYPLACSRNGKAAHNGYLISPRVHRPGKRAKRPPLLPGDLFGTASDPDGGRATHKVLTSLVDSSVERGLHWLMRHQEQTGYWDSDSFFTTCDRIRCSGPGGPMNDVGVTSLAVLALLTSPKRYSNPDYRAAAWKGLRYLLELQDKDTGQFGTKSCFHFNYCHALAQLCLLEALGRTGNPALVSPARKGLDYIMRAQTKGAGWRYRFPSKGESDTSLTSWMLNDLILGQRLHLGGYEKALKSGFDFIEEMTDPKTGRVGYMTRGSLSARLDEAAMEAWPQDRGEALTAAALECRLLHGVKSVESKTEKLALELILDCPPEWNPAEGCVDYYYWYYASQLVTMAGSDFEMSWYLALTDALMKGQQSEGCERGSWDPSLGPWGKEGGRVYSTALSVLSLSAPERYNWDGADRR